jgi:hypothetical protein
MRQESRSRSATRWNAIEAVRGSPAGRAPEVSPEGVKLIEINAGSALVEVDVVALAGVLTCGNRGENRDRHPQTRGEIRDRKPGLHRTTAALAGEAHDAAHRLEHGVLALLEYNPQAAELAWKRTLEFLEKHVKR